jgi:hypothetical protein
VPCTAGPHSTVGREAERSQSTTTCRGPRRSRRHHGYNLLSLLAEPLCFAVLAGFALFLVVRTTLGVSMWRDALCHGCTQPWSHMGAE